MPRALSRTSARTEVLTPFVGFRLRHIAYPAEVELPRLPAQAILRGQVLMDWRTEHGDA